METSNFEHGAEDPKEPIVEPVKKGNAKEELSTPEQSDAAKRHSEQLRALDKKYFDKPFKTSQEEVAAYQDYETERDELSDQ